MLCGGSALFMRICLDENFLVANFNAFHFLLYICRWKIVWHRIGPRTVAMGAGHFPHIQVASFVLSLVAFITAVAAFF